MKKTFNIVLLPGWKNDKRSLYIFKDKLMKYGNLVFIDFPILIDNNPLTLDDYILLLHGKIKNLDNVILLGHSFGGKLATFYALRYKVEALILVAPSTYIKTRFKTKVLLFLNKIFNKLNLKKPKFLKGSSNYQDLNDLEKITFKNVLKYLNKEKLNEINNKTLIFGFDKDESIKINDLKYLNKNIKNSILKIYKGDHFSYMDNIYDIVIDIGDFINEIC